MTKHPSRSKTSQYHPLIYWLLSHARALLFAAGELARAPISNLMTILVVGIAIALPSGLYIVLQNFSELSENWNSAPTISLYLQKPISDLQRTNLMQTLTKNPKIRQIKYISPEQGLKEFSEFTQFKDIANHLGSNPLPGVIVVYPKLINATPQALQQLLGSLKNYPGVDIGKLDMQWIKRLSDMVILGKRVINALAIIFSVGVVLIIGNTIRLSLQNHLQEIEVLKLIGATHQFIRRPLLYRGWLYGLLGGVVAWGLIALVMFWLEPPAIDLANSYQHTLIIRGLTVSMEIKVIILSSLLGLLGAWLSCLKIRDFNFKQIRMSQ